MTQMLVPIRSPNPNGPTKPMRPNQNYTGPAITLGNKKKSRPKRREREYLTRGGNIRVAKKE